MKDYKYLLKNLGILSIGQFSTKFLTFFLVPLYTSVLTTEQYGIYDLLNTTVILMVPIVTLNIADAVLRFSLDKNNDNIIQIGIIYSVIGIVICCLFCLLNRIFNFFSVFNQYLFFFFLLFVATTFNTLLTSYARGIDKIASLTISSILSSTVIIFLNIFFLLYLKIGLTGYFLANIIGVSIQAVYLIFKLDIKRKKSHRKEDILLSKKMTKYSIPLIANSISWWINNVSDRYVITWLCGISANGIYSVGYKIPSILNIFQTIFSQAWTLSAVKSFNKEDTYGFFSNMYNMYNFCMTVICSVLIITAKLLAKYLYINSFYCAWQYVPFLLIAVLFGSLSGYIGGIFAASKNSKIFGLSSAVGAIVNIILNIVLVNFIGTIGAAISTTISFWIVWVIRCSYTTKIIKIKFNLKRDYLSYALLIIQSFLLFYINKSNFVFYLLETILFVIILICYKNELKKIMKKMHIISN
ncbi:oligosaccharide flippase family protein [Thomasclavelia sp.]|uniref:lipopolysaccharide biosynthesis protein n=1 Tax=Thomasclavelia sp. TaxID=3025757 RepID=UPI0025CE2E13|nr:oligosaccharide flippase family protein [Thomasclavelia sp.]